MRATHSKKVGTGSNKRPEKLNVHIRNSWRTNLQLIRSIGNMIGYKKSLSEWQCLSEVKMGRGLPIPPMLRRKIVEQYQKGVSQRKIAKSLKLSSSTVHNIIQRFRESKFKVIFGKLGRHVIRTKEGKDNPSCYQRSVQKPASLMVWGCMSACGQLTHLERHHQCWKVYPSSRTTYAPIQTSSLSGKTLHFPTWQCQTTYRINYNIMAA